MIVSGLNENESQEREQGRIMWREIEFHLYRVHLLTLRFFGGNGAKPTTTPPHQQKAPPATHTTLRMHFKHPPPPPTLCCLCFQSKRVDILSSFCDIWVQAAL